MVDHVADILGGTMGHDHNHDELRSIAMGWLARPVELIKLLLDHTRPPPPRTAAEQPAWVPDHMADTLDRLCALPARKLAQLRGHGRLFVHLTDEALRSGVGVARVEGVGPIDVRQLPRSSATADVTVTPVLDLRERRRVDAYEHPESTKDHVWVQTGGDCFPFTPRTATRDGVDFDHAIPYDDTGPPGQTGSHNSGPSAPQPSPREDPRRTHHSSRRPWSTPVAYAPRPVVPRRPHRDDPADCSSRGGHGHAIDDGVELYFTEPLGYATAG